jgi:hypothetical protein
MIYFSGLQMGCDSCWYHSLAQGARVDILYPVLGEESQDFESDYLLVSFLAKSARSYHRLCRARLQSTRESLSMIAIHGSI